MATPLYNVGTATLTNGSAAMVGQGTLWLGNVRPGDQVVSYTGQTAIVGTVDSNTSITLARAYRGTSQTAQAYEILYTPDDPFTQQLAREVLQAISASALVKLGGVTPAARKLVRFDANANAALSDLSDFGLAVAALTGANGGIIRATGAGSAVMQAIVGAVSQSGGVPTGAIVERGSNANGEYARLADGTVECWRRCTFSRATATRLEFPWTFPTPVPHTGRTALALLPYTTSNYAGVSQTTPMKLTAHADRDNSTTVMSYGLWLDAGYSVPKGQPFPRYLFTLKAGGFDAYIIFPTAPRRYPNRLENWRHPYRQRRSD